MTFQAERRERRVVIDMVSGALFSPYGWEYPITWESGNPIDYAFETFL